MTIRRRTLTDVSSPYAAAMPVVGFLHTSPAHVARFDALAAELAPECATAVVVDELLLSAARRSGVDDPGVRDGISAALADLLHAGARVVVCTCSTIGAVAEQLGDECGARVVRVDRPMIESALGAGRRIAAVVAVESTAAPTRALIESVAAARSAAAEISIVVSEGAWARFEAGDIEGYLQSIADTCDSLDGSVDVIVLAQASMADAADRVGGATPVLSSPRLAVSAAAELAR